MFTLDRREFLKTCGAGAAAAGVGMSGLRLAFGADAGGNNDTLIVVFMRGGCDGLHLVPPTGGADRGYYEQARPDIQIPVTGAGAALALGNNWGLHPSATDLHQLYQSGNMAVVLGAGMPAPVTRSHFNAQITMELGTPGTQDIGSGWLTRHLASMGLPANVPIPTISAGSLTATSLIADHESITMGSGGDFRINNSAWTWNARDHHTPPPAGFNGLVETLPQLWADNSALGLAGQQTLNALGVIRPMDFGGYTPSPGANYVSNNGFAQQLKMLAQLIKAGVGLRVATIDIASWDTHNGQNNMFADVTQRLSQGLGAFYKDLAGAPGGNYMNKVSVIAMSEFGRRVRQNGSNGTDHGYGNVMLALGGGVNGGQIYGLSDFAGLADEALFDGGDVQVSIDFRRVLSEAMIRRQQNNHLGQVFPGYADYSPLGIFQGADIAPDYSDDFDTIFKGGFDG